MTDTGPEYPHFLRDTLIQSLSEGEHILLLGGGSGADAVSAAIKVGPAGQVVNLDTDQDRISSARLSAAAQKLRSPHISIVHGDPYGELPIAADSVHCVVTSFAVDVGKETLLKEAYRVLRPGGRIYVGTILSPTSDEVAKSAEGGPTIATVALCEQIFTDAGFKEISLSNPKVGKDVTRLGSPKGSAGHAALDAVGAPYQIYALKPGTSTGKQPDVLLRWWDAFPIVASAPPGISAEEVMALIRSPSAPKPDYVVIDVRRNDHQGGHVRGSEQWPAQTFHDDLPEFFGKHKNTEKVIFYCGSSQGRGPRCAGWYQDYLDGVGGEHGSKAYVLTGGVKEWLKKFTGHEDLVDYD